MFLKYVQMRNYKNLVSGRFEFGKGANTVIGENDSGKSNAMTAMRILLDSTYFYNTKRLKETDFSDALGDWKGHWIIFSAYFDEISDIDKCNEVCAEIIPEEEDADFLKSYIRCQGYDYGVVTLFIRPMKNVRKMLAEANNEEEFKMLRNKITLSDYEFFYTSRSQADFTDEHVYKKIVGDIENGIYVNPEEDDSRILGNKIDILSVWQHISVVFIDALRDVESELRKPKNPLRRVFDVIQNSVLNSDKEKIKTKIHELNESISSIQQISDIGHNVNDKLNEIVGLVYSPEITVESRLREDIDSLAKYLAVSPTGHEDIDLLGLGHLNILYIALKLVEFEYNRNHEIVNIMIIEEPEAHIHTHIQKTLFDNLKLANNYTQVIMTTHSTHLSEVADIKRVNIMKAEPSFSVIMKPTRGLDEFGKNNLEIKDLSLSSCLERYLDAKRSVLLFSKGVILVEGDGEEILFPAMIKKAFGVSLDEIGIGLINVGNVAFEYLACLFGEERLQRYCAIVTDYDAILEGATKCSEEAEKRGKSRKEKLARLFGANPWVESFFAPYTFEVDFANEKNNRSYIEKIISTHYVDKNTIKRHIANINSSEEKRYDAVLTVATAMRKGWYATVLSSIIDEDVIIPKYLLKALAYASQDVLTSTILLKIACYVLDCYTEDEDIKDLKHKFKNANTEILIKGAMDCFCHLLPDNNLSLLIKYREEIKQT